jgi:putative endonuclease
MEKKQWILYMLQCGDGTLYTGVTNDLDARFAAHTTGKGAKYTRGRGPLQIVYTELCENYSAALKRERQVKALSRQEKLKMVQK